MKAYKVDHPTGVYDMTPALIGLIDLAGAETFPGTLFKMAHAMTGCGHLTAFAFDRDADPLVLIAENAGQRPVARDVANHYRSTYWRHDLANQVMAGTPTSGSATWCIRTRASEIKHSDYRSACYTSVGLGDRICIAGAPANRTIRINLYRSGGNAFSDSDEALIARGADMLLALIARHARDARAAQRGPAQDVRARLLRVAPVLSTREADVCAGIMEGLTSEGIALRLDIGINTVLTYRKRAYARLGISSQNELLRLVMD
ncbi:helix-turn-helix transcriptional regulator [Bradyrhizobium sp. SSUT112]|uniref:helix-turn-helix transcriptional regulator n=1 Tax=Bradyrhizobium sp. SSUT112 TaxID=3040604 RepID=UPI002449421E|nr:helix-turn-helix transcriptional regulator [Bradyrhizobium sp. SSUT112]MDH2355198.1 helix-turn-helix transcriptional regulator [Bradyrhizobium sp. SSUT112]